VAADMFAVIAYQRCLIAVAVGVVGYLPMRWIMTSHTNRSSLFFVVLTISAVVLAVATGTGWQFRIIRIPTGIFATVLPLIIGYMFRSAPHAHAQYSRLMVACAAVLAVFGANLRLIGAGHAIKVMTTGLTVGIPSFEEKVAKTPKDFMVITLVSKGELPFVLGEHKVSGGYTYVPKPSEFLRFVAEDESKYYLIANKAQKLIPFVVRRDVIAAMMFEPGPGVPRPTF